MTMRRGLLKFLLLLAGFESTGFAQKRPAPASDGVFPTPPMVKRQADFWVKVFQRYDGSTIMIHDPEFVDLVIDVVDFKQFRDKYNDGRAFSRAERRDIINRYVERYQLAISRLQKLGKKALEYGPMEQRVLQVYSKRKETLARLFTEEIYLRTQPGMADEFPKAAERAENYLPYMERIFQNRGLPIELTRIAFVESMFNRQALSKVGASGIWQFMPNTARSFMTVNSHIDERLSPLKASHGASILLAENMSILKAWPLAITAYNHGASGMQRAVKKLGTRDFDEILLRYNSPTFGFASRNFYSEFLAAKQVYRDLQKQRISANKNPMRIDRVRLDQPLSIHQLVTHTALKEETLASYNHCLLPKAFTNYRNKPLPRGFEIIVPQEIATSVRRSIKELQYSLAKKSRPKL